ncbi:unnamed protein product [Pleuronectes platessa]|uniref:Uncharacterized protein n=1 Tax=Pleuronectes platessa TaxID=8262 RepID=A0A9N7UVY7_PLEPL|nr:unnamed protein product [Pleuronectes platessa]
MSPVEADETSSIQHCGLRQKLASNIRSSYRCLVLRLSLPSGLLPIRMLGSGSVINPRRGQGESSRGSPAVFSHRLLLTFYRLFTLSPSRESQQKLRKPLTSPIKQPLTRRLCPSIALSLSHSASLVSQQHLSFKRDLQSHIASSAVSICPLAWLVRLNVRADCRWAMEVLLSLHKIRI